MLETIEYKGHIYPKFQSTGFAAKFAIPFAKEVCVGKGYDIGCNKPEWALPDAMLIDKTIDDEYDALNLPNELVDYIFSSHCLEHINDWATVLDYWISKLKAGGILFLYLPDLSQVYWRPWHNKKHVNVLTPEIIYSYLTDRDDFDKIFISGIDLNNSFMVMASKKI